MPAVFTGRWTRGTIIDQALQRVGNVKIKQLARDRLNRIEEDLYTQWEWPFLYKVVNVAFPSGNTGGQLSIYPSFTLPDDFLKTETETTGLRIITLDGNPVDRAVIELDPISFRRQAIPHDMSRGGLSSSPRIWYPSYAERIGYFWPAPTQANLGILIYKFLPPEQPIGDGQDSVTVAYDASIPLFPWGGYLSMAVEYWALQYDENPRSQEALADCSVALDTIRNIAMPRQSQEPVLPLDPLTFGRAFRDDIGWGWRNGGGGEWWW